MRSGGCRVVVHNSDLVPASWSSLQEVTLNDSQINSWLRGTVVYRTLQSVAHHQSLLMLPAQASVVPLRRDLQRRWPKYSEDDIEALLSDYEWERDQLDSNGVKVYYDQIVRLYQEDSS